MKDPIRKSYWRDFTTNPAWAEMVEHLAKVEDDWTRGLVRIVAEGEVEQMKVQSGKIEGVRGTMAWLMTMKEQCNND